MEICESTLFPRGEEDWSFVETVSDRIFEAVVMFEPVKSESHCSVVLHSAFLTFH